MFCEKLIKLRKENNLTQEELAEKIYVSRSAVAKWEQGRGLPNEDSLESLSRIFSISIDELLKKEDLKEYAINSDKRVFILSKKNKLFVLLSLILSVCSIIGISLSVKLYNENKNRNIDDSFETISPIGTAPNTFEFAVKNNLLFNSLLSFDGFYRVDLIDNYYLIKKYDYSFKIQKTFKYCSKTYNDSEKIEFLTTVSDGSIIMLIKTISHYDYSTESRHINNPLLIKFNSEGIIQWEYKFDNPYINFSNLYEMNNYFYILGDEETLESKEIGTFSSSVFCAYKIDMYGNLITSNTYGGSDFDYISYSIPTGNGFRLYGYTQSKDGNFSLSTDGYGVPMSFFLDENLILKSYRIEADKSCFSNYYYTKEGKKYYSTEAEIVFFNNNYDETNGYVKCMIEYDNFYLVVSNHRLGINYEILDKFPNLSSIPYFWETVYCAYSYDGTILWRVKADF